MMHRRLGEWFAERYRPEAPFFIFLNYIEAHGPYDPPSAELTWASDQTREKWKLNQNWRLIDDHMMTGLDLLSPSDIAELEALYDEEIAYVDRKLGRLFAFLGANGLDENTLVIVTADHGEHLGEHGVFSMVIRVPITFPPEKFNGVILAGMCVPKWTPCWPRPSTTSTTRPRC